VLLSGIQADDWRFALTSTLDSCQKRAGLTPRRAPRLDERSP
jgi:hypothetical protein